MGLTLNKDFVRKPDYRRLLIKKGCGNLMNNTNIVANRALSHFSEKMVILTAGICFFIFRYWYYQYCFTISRKEFHSTVTITAWSVTIYVTALSATIPLFGKLSDRV